MPRIFSQAPRSINQSIIPSYKLHKTSFCFSMVFSVLLPLPSYGFCCCYDFTTRYPPPALAQHTSSIFCKCFGLPVVLVSGFVRKEFCKSVSSESSVVVVCTFFFGSCVLQKRPKTGMFGGKLFLLRMGSIPGISLFFFFP